jgi:hypothetical protein
MSSIKQIFWVLFLGLGFALGAVPYPQKDIDSGKVLAALSKKAFDNAMNRLEHSGTNTCNKKNVRVFKEWYCYPYHAKTNRR